MLSIEVFHTLLLTILIQCEPLRAIPSDSNDLSQHPNVGHNYLYLNYKEVYGLRYDPKNSRKKVDANYVPNDGKGDHIKNENRPIERSTTTTTGDVIEMISISPLSFTVDATDEMPSDQNEGAGDGDHMDQTSQAVLLDTTLNSANNDNERERLTKLENFTEMAEEQTKSATETSTTISASSSSSSSLRNILSLVRTRLKQWFSFGNNTASNGERFLNVFNVIQFDNSVCTSTKSGYSDVSGICYPDYQCSQMGGLVIDYCADGMGACCICK